MVTSRDVTARVAEILPDWPVSDLRTRERWLIQAGVVPKGRAGRGGAGLAPVTLRQALLFVLSLAAPTAVGGPKYVRRAAGSQGSDGQTLMEALEYAAEYSIARGVAARNEDYKASEKLSKEPSLYSLELPCWDGKMYITAAALIRWVGHPKGEGLTTDEYCVVPKGMRRVPKEIRAGKKEPKRPKRVKPPTADEIKIKRIPNPEPIVMRLVRMDRAVINGVAALFAEDGA